MVKSYVRWIKKNDPSAYHYWKKHLAPAIGESVLRSRDAVFLFGRSHLAKRLTRVDQRITSAHRKIERGMSGRETMVGALITYDFLHHLARYRHRRLCAYRRGRKA